MQHPALIHRSILAPRSSWVAALVIGLVCLLAVLPSRASAAGGPLEVKAVSGASTTTLDVAVEPGKRATYEVEVRNTGKSSRRLHVDGVDLDGTDFAARTDRHRGTSRWIRSADRRIRVAGGEAVRVRIQVRVPKGTAKGDNPAGIAFEPVNGRGRRVVLPVTVRVAASTPAAALPATGKVAEIGLGPSLAVLIGAGLLAAVGLFLRSGTGLRKKHERTVSSGMRAQVIEPEGPRWIPDAPPVEATIDTTVTPAAATVVEPEPESEPAALISAAPMPALEEKRAA